MSQKLLLVEDEEHLAFMVEFNLSEEGYTVDVAPNLAQARALLTESYDLIILDVMLPDGDGMDFCAELRTAGNLTPILMLTAKGASEDIVSGLNAGADDYITKPFALGELLGRIGALMRRQRWAQRGSSGESDTFTIGEHVINFTTHEVSKDRVAADITELELRLLRFFIDHAGEAISRQSLLEEVWGISGSTNTRTVDNFIVRLRRLFEPDPASPRHFLTIRGHGYRFVGNPGGETPSE